jgi:hypothetical protein
MPHSFGPIEHTAAIVVLTVLPAPLKPLIFTPHPAARMWHCHTVLEISAATVFCCHNHFNAIHAMFFSLTLNP